MGAPTGRVRGVLYLDYVRQLRLQFPGWPRALEPEVARHVALHVDPLAWYDMAALEAVGLALLDHVVHERMDVIRLWGRETLTGVLVLLPHLRVEGTPHESIANLAGFISGLFDFPVLRLPRVDEREAVVAVGWGMDPRAEEAATWQAIGFFEELVSASGGREVSTTLDAPARESAGRGQRTFTLRWKLEGPPSGALARKPRVLIVDDDELVARSLRRLLGRVAEVTVALGAAQAIAQLERDAFDVIISDWDMPERDGLSLLAEVRQRWPSTRRVLHSGRLPDPAADAAVGAGVVHQALRKGAPQDVLVAALAVPPPR